MSDQKECKKCQQKSFKIQQWGMIFLGFFLLFSSVYGMVEMVKDLFSFFK